MSQVRLSSMIAFVVSIASLCQAGNNDLNTIKALLLKQSEHLTRVQSIEMTYTETYHPCWTDSRFQVLSDQTYKKVRYAQAHNKYRFDILEYRPGQNRSDLVFEETTAHSVITYDGLSMQQFYKEWDRLVTDTERIDPMVHGHIPLYNLFTWNHPTSSQALVNPNHWTEWSKHSVVLLPSIAMVNNMNCVVLEIDIPEKNEKVRVHFAEAYDFYPVMVENMSSTSERVYQRQLATDLLKKVTADGIVVIPLEMTAQYWNRKTGEATNTCTYAIDRNTLAINHDIPDNRFTIPQNKSQN